MSREERDCFSERTTLWPLRRGPDFWEARPLGGCLEAGEKGVGCELKSSVTGTGRRRGWHKWLSLKG